MKLSNGKRLIKIRNPWGSEGYKGSYSDKSEDWDEEAKQEAGWKDADDGVFFVDIDSYKQHFSETWISYDVKDWASAKFLKLNDETQKESPGIWEGVCGPDCTRHTMTLTSEVA